MVKKCENYDCESEEFNLKPVGTEENDVEVYDLVCAECGLTLMHITISEEDSSP